MFRKALARLATQFNLYNLVLFFTFAVITRKQLRIALIVELLKSKVMCMRPCGPVRNYYRQPREITKKEVLELLQNKSYTSIEIYENEQFVSEYIDNIPKLKSLIRKGESSVYTTNDYRFIKYRKDGYRTIIVKSSNNHQIIVMRQLV